MTRRIFFIADDYGLSPSVNAAILALIGAGRLSGTSCMTGFAEWQADAARLRLHAGATAIGLHLTLTDHPALSGCSTLAPDGRLQPLRQLVLAQISGRLDKGAVHAELDAQHARFLETLGRMPDFIDGHQHVHFLPVVRDWLLARFAGSPDGARPTLRGAPRQVFRSAKTAAVAMMAAGFDETMSVCGFRLLSPLSGFYDWSKPSGFEAVVKSAVAHLPDGAIFMCHPGGDDETLRARDGLVDARAAEFRLLSSQEFVQCLTAADARIGRLHG